MAPIDRELPANFPNHSPIQIRQNLLLGTEALDSFEGKANFSVESPDRSGRFSAEVRARQGDSLYLSISPGLGIEAARVLVTPDSLYLYNRIENRLTYGSLEEAGDMLGLPVAADDLYRNLLGIIAPEADIEWDVRSDDAYYYLTDPDGTIEFTIDPALWRVVHYEERTPDGELIEERTFEEFDQIQGYYLPRQVVFRRPQEEAAASLYYRSLELNPESLSFGLRVSESVERVEVGSSK